MEVIIHRHRITLYRMGRYMFVAQEVKRFTYFIYLYIDLFVRC